MDSNIRRIAWVVSALAITTGLACSGSGTPPSQPEPEPEGPKVMEEFSGQIGQNGTSCHNYTITTEGGSIEMELTELQPLTTLTVGLALGRPDTSTVGCAPFATDDTVKLNEKLLSSGLAAGAYCSCITDVGNIFPGEIVDYTLSVIHSQ